ncbi:hypothetical protein AB6A40_010031 [Gnathostoma spinigerum]|uniref:Phospholipid/glycerol acyltransferase domain-containing protein n=1 Tax=Gnathostoma spinigerum TaxID=75299 RepID=A0ABD6EW40_9BILA
MLGLIIGLSLIFPIFPIVILIIVILACLGKSAGVREKYAEYLIKTFEWGSTQEESVYGHRSEDDDLVADDRKETEKQKLKRRRRRSSGSYGIIVRKWSESIDSKLKKLDDSGEKHETIAVIVDDTFDFIMAGIESIIEDQVTSRFKAEELASWNLLTRTSIGFQHINWKLTCLWLLGFFLRYCILMPARLVLFVVGMVLMVIITSAVGYVSNPALKRWLNEHAMLMCMRICSRAFSSIIHFHDRENRATHGGICVANHTSPIDVMILSCDNCYAMVGQRQPGILGRFPTAY